MRISTFLAFGTLALLCNCSNERFAQGRGDAGQFILQHAIAYGGHPTATNGLPVIDSDWRYVQDEFGTAVLLPVSQYPAIDAYLRSAFGPPSNSAAWAVRDFGVAIYLQRVDTNTEIGIYPPMSNDQMARMAQKMDEMVKKNMR